MPTVLVTGATGLVGSNVCLSARENGWTPRALMRSDAYREPLAAFGTEFAPGDIRDPDALVAAAKGCDYIVHTAALVPTATTTDRNEFVAINVDGTRNVLAAARANGVRRVVSFSTSIHEEDGSLQPAERLVEPYAATKSAAFRDVQAAVADGLDAVTIVPGAVVGPAPTGQRAVEPPGFNARFVLALAGKIESFPGFYIEPVLAKDVGKAAIAALERGKAGEVYFTYAEKVDTVDLFNLVCEAAGISHRVRRLTEAELESDETLRTWGTSVARFALEAMHARRAGRAAPEHAAGSQRTQAALGMSFSSPQTVAKTTAEWMREQGFA
jgi:nucleoside-diphosphate-sugar epimerase